MEIVRECRSIKNKAIEYGILTEPIPRADCQVLGSNRFTAELKKGPRSQVCFEVCLRGKTGGVVDVVIDERR